MVARILPGTYRVIAQATVEGGGDELGDAIVTVEDQDAEAQITTKGPMSVRGRILTTSGTPPPVRFHVAVAPLDGQRSFFTSAGSVLAKDDGSFEAGVLGTSFRVGAGAVGNASQWRVRDVRWKGQSVRNGVQAEGSVSVEGIEVVVVPATARLQGTASDGASPLMQGTVVLAPSDWELHQAVVDWHRAVVMNGRFVSPQVPSGPYVVAVVDAVAPEAITPEVVALVRAQGLAVELGEHETKTVELTTVIRLPR